MTTKNILLLTHPKADKNTLLEILTNQGLHIIHETNPISLYERAQQSVGLLIVDHCENTEPENVDVLEKIRSANPKLPILLINKETDTEILARIANLNISGIFSCNTDPAPLIQHVNQIISATELTSTENHFNGDYSHNPPQALYLASVTTRGRRRLKTLWDQFHQGNHIFVSTEPGAEFELLLHEITQWNNQIGRKALWIKPTDLMHGDTLKTLNNLTQQAAFSTVVGIRDIDPKNLEQLNALHTFVTEKSSQLSQAQQFKFIYELSPTDLTHIDATHPELGAYIHLHFSLLSPLNTRLADLAYYLTQHTLQSTLKSNTHVPINFTPEALRLILSHPWTANYTELQQFLQRLDQLPEKELITEKTTRKLLNLPNETPASQPPSKLNELLWIKQIELLNNHIQKTKCSLPKILNELEVMENSLQTIETPEELPLLYPELADSLASSKH